MPRERDRHSAFTFLPKSAKEELSDDPDLQRLLLGAGLSSRGHTQETLSKLILNRAINYWKYPFSPGKSSGDIIIGETIEGQEYSISEDILAQHLLAVGQSGSGKTNLLLNIMAESKSPFWSFDLKQDYRHLASEEELLVLPWTEFRFNPLKPPPGVPPRRWAQVFAEIFGHATGLLSGSKNQLLKQVFEIYEVYDLFDWLSPPYPSLLELQDLVASENINYVRTTSDYRDRLLNRLEAMNLSAGTVFDCSQGYTLEELLHRNVVFEFDGLNRDVQNFLMEILFAYVYEYRLAQNQRGGELRHVFFLDEGKQVFSVYKERRDASGIPEIDELTAKMREFGEGLVVADQEASKLTDSIKANTYTKVLLPTGDRKQFNTMAESMNLSERQMEFAQQLGIGEAVVQVGNRELVPVKLQNYELEKCVSDEELRGHQEKLWDRLSFEPRDPTPEFEQRVLHGQSPSETRVIPGEPSKTIELSEQADHLLKDVVENPFLSLTERYDGFSSSYQGNKAKDGLVDQGIVVERSIKTRTGRRKLLQLTDKGREYVENQLDLEVKRNGRGGIVHQYWQHRIMEAFETEGWTVSLEKQDADVLAVNGNTVLAVEVAMGNNPREIEHVKKHLDKCDTVWIACRNQEVRDGLKQRIMEKGLQTDRVVFRLFRELDDVQLTGS